MDATGFFKQIFAGIIVIGLIGVDGAAFGQVESEKLQAIDIADTSWGEEKLDGVARCSNHQVDLQPIEIASFTGGIASVGFLLIQSCPADADIVTHRHRKGVDEIGGVSILLFPSLAKDLK